MEPTQQPVPLAQFYDVLPPRYKTWLELYDSLAEHYQKLDKLRIMERLERAEYYQRFHQEPRQLDIDGLVNVEYNFNRDYILARIAEEVLRFRLPSAEIGRKIDWLRASVRDLDSADTPMIYIRVTEELKPLFELAFAISKK